MEQRSRWQRKATGLAVLARNAATVDRAVAVRQKLLAIINEHPEAAQLPTVAALIAEDVARIPVPPVGPSPVLPAVHAAMQTLQLSRLIHRARVRGVLHD